MVARPLQDAKTQGTSGAGHSMSKVVVFNHVTLDGVMQAPGRPDEDRRGGFTHGGWAAARMDSVMGEVTQEAMASRSTLLFGRFTYEGFASFWPKQKDNPITEVLNEAQKYVASRTLSEPLPWQNSTLLKGDASEAVGRLKKIDGKDLVILGSGELIQSLMRHRLIDRFVLMIHPVVLGAGRRLFGDGGPVSTLQLVDTKPTTTGVVIATYELAADNHGSRT